MSNVVPFRRETEVEAAPPVEIPVHIVQAIAIAAVEAYKEQERLKRLAYQKAYRKVNRDRINARERRRRALKRT